jgi:tetratricopeptide (TPR) repeat protein
MKILLSNAVVSHGAFHHWMTADLRALGHEVSTLDPDELCEQFGIELYRRVLLQRIAADKPDVFICYPPYDLLREEENRAIHESGTAIVGFAYDDPIFLPSYVRNPGDFEKIAAEFRKTYDVYLTTSRDMVKQAVDRDIHFMEHIRWACVTPSDPGNGVRDLPLVVIGAPYPRRVNMVKHLKNAGVKPIVFGAEGWRQFLDVADCYNGMLTRPGMFEMYRRAKIALAPADWESNYTPMVKLRSLEITAMAPLQIIEQCEDLYDYFEDGKEVVSYRAHDWDQLVELIKQYLADEPARARIARAGYERLLRDHVWKVRWKEIEERALPVIERIRAGNRGMISRATPEAPAEEAGSAADMVSVARGAYDPHLAQELGLSACAMHYEKLGDLNTAMIATDEWLAVRPDYYANLLEKARLLFHQKNYCESETYFKRALEAGKGLCNLGVDITVTQRKLGPRFGLGRMFSGIFPRHLECNAHLLLIYALTDQQQKAEEFMSEVAGNQDHLFVSIVAIIAETAAPNPNQPPAEAPLPPKYLARYVEVLLTCEPNVWAGEKKRHRAHFWLLRGQALAALGDVPQGRQCLMYALTQEPYPQVEQQIRKQLAVMG